MLVFLNCVCRGKSSVKLVCIEPQVPPDVLEAAATRRVLCEIPGMFCGSIGGLNYGVMSQTVFHRY